MNREKKNKLLFFAIPFVLLNIWLVCLVVTNNIPTPQGSALSKTADYRNGL